jgi:hypothetical protein
MTNLSVGGNRVGVTVDQGSVDGDLMSIAAAKG